ncbi:MAG TPA: VOC family protein [Gemmatimonadaceae bacterium]|nr:VOC family protein [Gemmatimonadaceae bacterium]
MIFGAHFLLYSKTPEADRAFLRDVLGFDSVDAGGGWPIFALPPSEFAVHPSHAAAPAKTEDGHAGAGLYLMCDDLKSTMKLMEKRVHFSKVEDALWGTVTSFALPSGAKVGLYQPKHPTAFKR